MVSTFPRWGTTRIEGKNRGDTLDIDGFGVFPLRIRRKFPAERIPIPLWMKRPRNSHPRWSARVTAGMRCSKCQNSARKRRANPTRNLLAKKPRFYSAATAFSARKRPSRVRRGGSVRFPRGRWIRRGPATARREAKAPSESRGGMKQRPGAGCGGRRAT